MGGVVAESDGELERTCQWRVSAALTRETPTRLLSVHRPVDTRRPVEDSGCRRNKWGVFSGLRLHRFVDAHDC